MTFSESRLLRKLKKAQIELDRDVYISFETMTAKTGGNGQSKVKTVKLSAFKGSIKSLLLALTEKGYLQREYGNEDELYVQVTLDGWCAFQTTVRSALSFTFKDIVVPLFVAFTTALLTSLIISS